jgi:hypothetical protein
MALLKADEALYEAKQAGRDRLCIHDRTSTAGDTLPAPAPADTMDQAA